MTYREATVKLPANAVWSCSFGYPGNGGFVEYYRDDAGTVYRLSNGPWDGGGALWALDVVSSAGA